MHYGAYAFSSNQKPTITPKESGVTIGQRNALSATDIVEIRNYYGCSNGKIGLFSAYTAHIFVLSPLFHLFIS